MMKLRHKLSGYQRRRQLDATGMSHIAAGLSEMTWAREKASHGLQYFLYS
jgi:hypothetical protein